MAYTYERPDEEYDSYVSSPYTDTTYYTWPSAPLTPDSPRSGSSLVHGSEVSGSSSARRRRHEEREASTHLTPAPEVYVNVSSSRRRGGRRGSLVICRDAPLTPRRSPEIEPTRIVIRENSPSRRERSSRVARPVILDSRHSSREHIDVDIEIENRPRESRRHARSRSGDRQRRGRTPSNPPSLDRVYSWSDEEASTRRRASRSRSRRRKPTLKVEFADKDEIIETPAVSAVPRALSADTREVERHIRNQNRRIESRPAVPDPVIVQSPVSYEYKRGHVDVPVHRRRLSREERDQLEFREQRERLIRRQEPGRAKRRESLSVYAPPMSNYH